MRSSVQAVHGLVNGIDPWDDREAEHREDTLRWLASTDDVFRRVKPASPDRHLVSYVALVDPSDGSALLVDHVSAGLWLPPGGHVEPGEHPAQTARREVKEELGIEAVFATQPESPSFITVTRTVGIGHGHVDVSLWFLLVGDRSMDFTTDPREFSDVRWWTPAEVRDAPRPRFDPHYRRFVAKLTASAG